MIKVAINEWLICFLFRMVMGPSEAKGYSDGSQIFRCIQLLAGPPA